MTSPEDVERVAEAARTLPPAEESYLENDFVMNLLETVLDYQMNTKAVVRALEHFKEHRWSEVRTIEELEENFHPLPRRPGRQHGTRPAPVGLQHVDPRRAAPQPGALLPKHQRGRP